MIPKLFISAKKEFQEQYQQEQLSNAVVDGIIAGVLFFCSLVVVIFAIVKYRRPCYLVCKKTSQDLSSEECNMGHDNPGLSAENPGAVEIDEQVWSSWSASVSPLMAEYAKDVGGRGRDAKDVLSFRYMRLVVTYCLRDRGGH